MKRTKIKIFEQKSFEPPTDTAQVLFKFSMKFHKNVLIPKQFFTDQRKSNKF